MSKILGGLDQPISPSQGGTGKTAFTVALADLDSTLTDTAYRECIGCSLDAISALTSSNGSTITVTVQQAGGGDITLAFSDGPIVVDCTPPLTVSLTPGTDQVPINNFVYILKSAPTVLTVSTLSFPIGVEFSPIITVLCQSAATFQTYGAYKTVLFDNHLWKDTTELGLNAYTSLWILLQRPIFISGSALIPLLTPGAPDTLTISAGIGQFLKLRPVDTPAFNSATGGSTNLTTFFVTNVLGNNFQPGKNLYNFKFTSGGVAAANNDRICWVIWASISENSADYTLYVNLPLGFYSSDAAAIADDSLFTNYNIPLAYQASGVLIAKLVYTFNTGGGGDLTFVQNLDLRGSFPGATPGGSSVGGATTQLNNLTGVAINTSLIPGVNNSIDLGSPALRYRDAYIDGQVRTGQTVGNTYELTARDVDGAVDTPFVTLTAGNIPTCVLASSVTATTQPFATSDTTLATTAFVQASREQVVNPQTLAYTAVASDLSKVIRYTGAGAVDLSLTAAATLTDGWFTTLRNDSSGTITINPNGAETINGAATLPVAAGKAVIIYTNGVLFYTVGESSSGGGGGAGSLTFISSVTAASSASLVFTTGITNLYNYYLFRIEKLTLNTTDTLLYVRVSTDGGATYDATANYRSMTDTAGSVSAIATNVVNMTIMQDTLDYRFFLSAGNSIAGFVELHNAPDSSLWTRTFGQLIYDRNSGVEARTTTVRSGNTYGFTTPVNAIQFRPSSGLITSGKIYLFGVTL